MILDEEDNIRECLCASYSDFTERFTFPVFSCLYVSVCLSLYI